MKHETFRNVALGEAFDAIEDSILPSLTSLIETAAAAEPGSDAAAHADELRLLASQLDQLRRLFEGGASS